MDEDGEPLMDPDDVSFDRESSSYVMNPFDDSDDWHWERSPTPAFDQEKVGKLRKRLVKKSTRDSLPEPGRNPHQSAFSVEGFDDWDEEVPVLKKKMKKPYSDEWKRKALSKPGQCSGKGSASGSKGYDVDSSNHGGDLEMKEL